VTGGGSDPLVLAFPLVAQQSLKGLKLPAYFDDRDGAQLIVDKFTPEELADLFASQADLACRALPFPYAMCVEPELDGLQVALKAGLPAVAWRGEGADGTG